MGDRNFDIYCALGYCTTSPDELEEACTALGKRLSDRMWSVPLSKINKVFTWIQTSREYKRLKALRDKQESILRATEERLQHTLQDLKVAREKLGDLS